MHHQPKIENPCPMRAKKGGFDCKSCGKHVQDFTNSTQEQIAHYVSQNPNGCGTFYTHQLQPASKKPFGYKLKYTALVCCALLGFSVSPIYGQTQNKITVKKEEPVVQPKQESSKKHEFKVKHKKRKRGIWPFRRKITGYRTLYTPKF